MEVFVVNAAAIPPGSRAPLVRTALDHSIPTPLSLTTLEVLCSDPMLSQEKLRGPSAQPKPTLGLALILIELRWRSSASVTLTAH